MSEDKNPLGLTSIPSVSSEGLVPVGRRASLSKYLSALWGRRFFIVADSKARINSANRRNRLGHYWLFVNPLLSILAYWFIFGFILKSSRGVENFIGYLVVGVFLFQYTSQCMTGGIGAIRSGSAMIKGFQFPRAALPISVVVRNFLDFVPALIIMTIILAILPPIEQITWRAFLILPIIILMTLFNLGLSCLLARLGHKIPDLINVTSVISRFWLYGSGVFFVIDKMLAEHPALLKLMRVNPMYSYLELTRNSILYGQSSPWWMWASAVVWAVALLVVGFLYFWRGEESYGRP